MSLQADALILLTATPEPQETEAAKWILEAAHILRQVAHPSFEADGELTAIRSALRGVSEAMESAVFVDPRMQYWADAVRTAYRLASPFDTNSEGK